MEFLSRNVSADDNYQKKEKNLFQKSNCLPQNNAKNLFLLLLIVANNNLFEIAICGASVFKGRGNLMAILYLIKRQIFN